MFWLQSRVKSKERKRKEMSQNTERMMLKQKEDQEFMMKLFDWMSDHYMERKLDVNEILSEVSMNLADFEDNIKRITGLSPKEYVYDFRMKKAKEMLEQTNDDISDIIEAVGFKNHEKFVFYFQQKTGMTPQEYRDKHQESQSNESAEYELIE
jgi:transcriptional regulator GlxA family with amidase domain